jgi:LPXTG-motif cell wall-anchored protein
VQIRTVIGGALAGLALTAGLAAPALATDPAQPTVACTLTADGKATADISANGGVWKCDGSAKTWSWTKTETTTTQGQGANTDQKAKGDNNNQQSCTQQMQAGQTIAGNQYCLIAKGDINLNIAAAKPADCNGATCSGLPAEVQVQCSAGQTATIEAAGGTKAVYSCAKAANGATTMKKAAATAGSDDSLPVTGADAGTIALAGGIAVLMGALAVGFWAARRRRVSLTA